MYYFTFFIGERGSASPRGAENYLKINSVNVIDVVVETYHFGQDLQAGNAVVVRVNEGDRVWVSGGARTHIEGSNGLRLSTFTGLFLYV